MKNAFKRANQSCDSIKNIKNTLYHSCATSIWGEKPVDLIYSTYLKPVEEGIVRSPEFWISQRNCYNDPCSSGPLPNLHIQRESKRRSLKANNYKGSPLPREPLAFQWNLVRWKVGEGTPFTPRCTFIKKIIGIFDVTHVKFLTHGPFSSSNNETVTSADPLCFTVTSTSSLLTKS